MGNSLTSENRPKTIRVTRFLKLNSLIKKWVYSSRYGPKEVCLLSCCPYLDGGDLEWKFGAALAGSGNRVDANDVRTLLDRTGFQARLLCLGPPGFSFRGHETAAATSQRNEDKGADYEPTNSTRHPRKFTEDN